MKYEERMQAGVDFLLKQIRPDAESDELECAALLTCAEALLMRALTQIPADMWDKMLAKTVREAKMDAKKCLDTALGAELTEPSS